MARKKIEVAALDLIIGGGDTVDVTDSLKAMDDLDSEIAGLEQVIAADASSGGKAMLKLASFELHDDVLELLEFCINNVALNNTNRITDPTQKSKAEYNASMLTMGNYDLSEAIDLVVRSSSLDSAAGNVYGLCYAIQKASTFRSNLLYRRALDPTDGEARSLGKEQRGQAIRTEHGGEFMADGREDERSAPYGLHPGVNELGSVPADWTAPPAWEAVLSAYSDLYYYLQLLTEAFGWDVERPMPYAYRIEGEGERAKFHALYAASEALDHQEVSSQLARIKRDAKQTAARESSLANARLLLLNASRKRQVA